MFDATVVFGVLLGVALTLGVLAVARLARAQRPVLAPGGEAMREALHHAAAMLPHLRRGLSPRNARHALPHVRALVQAPAAALLDHERVLAVDGPTPLRPGDPLPEVAGDGARLRVDPHAGLADGVVRAVVSAPLRVGEEQVGALLVMLPAGRVRAEEARVVERTADLVSAQLGLAALAEREERLARAELKALRAQISPHFVYNAMAAIAGRIHADPEEARELLTEFASFTRYAFREQRSYVTLADELHYVEKYLVLERARFRDRLRVRVRVAPEVLQAAVPVLSLQPLVENAVRHGVERRDASEGPGLVQITGYDRDHDVELRVHDDGPGMTDAQAEAALAGRSGGVGLQNVDARLRTTFGEPYRLRVSRAEPRGTTVVMTVPKFRAGVHAA